MGNGKGWFVRKASGIGEGGDENKVALLSELDKAGFGGTDMYKVIEKLETDKGINSYREKYNKYAKAIKPEKKSQKLSDATSKQYNANNGLGGYGYTSTSLGGIVKSKKYDDEFSGSLNSIDNMRSAAGLNDLNQ